MNVEDLVERLKDAPVGTEVRLVTHEDHAPLAMVALSQSFGAERPTILLLPAPRLGKIEQSLVGLRGALEKRS